MNDPAVCVTGIGPVSTEGIGMASLGEIDLELPGAGWPRPIDGFDPSTYLGRRGWRHLPPATWYGVAAAHLAAEDARIATTYEEGLRTGVVVGTNFSTYATVERLDQSVRAEGVAGISPLEAPYFCANLPASHISLTLGYRGFNVVLTDLLVAACASLLVATQALHDGRADRVLAGGVEGVPPEAGSAVLGPVADEGAACLFLLEREHSASDRGARVRIRLTGGRQLFVPSRRRSPAEIDALLHPALDNTCPRLPHQLRVFTGAGDRFGQDVVDSISRWRWARAGTTELRSQAGAPQGCVTPLLALSSWLARPQSDSRLLYAAVGSEGQIVLLSFMADQ